MSTTTPNLELLKPADTEFIDIDVINNNYDILDAAAKLKIINSSENAVSISQLNFLDNTESIWKNLDEVRLYNNIDTLICKEGVTTGLLSQDNQIKIVSVSWNRGIPAVGATKGYISSDGNYHIYDEPNSQDITSLSAINDAMNQFLDKTYPIGSIYMSVSSTSPATLFGGLWERITGRFLLAATDSGNSGASQAAGNTGGTATVTLTATQSGIQSHSHTYDKSSTTTESTTLTIDQIPSHQHTLKTPSGAGGSTGWRTTTASGPMAQESSYIGATGGGEGHTHSITLTSTASETKSASATESHENMPPYLSVYVWKRTG